MIKRFEDYTFEWNRSAVVGDTEDKLEPKSIIASDVLPKA